jgi:hypothetical protein
VITQQQSLLYVVNDVLLYQAALVAGITYVPTAPCIPQSPPPSPPMVSPLMVSPPPSPPAV